MHPGLARPVLEHASQSGIIINRTCCQSQSVLVWMINHSHPFMSIWRGKKVMLLILTKREWDKMSFKMESMRKYIYLSPPLFPLPLTKRENHLRRKGAHEQARNPEHIPRQKQLNTFCQINQNEAGSSPQLAKRRWPWTVALQTILCGVAIISQQLFYPKELGRE